MNIKNGVNVLKLQHQDNWMTAAGREWEGATEGGG